MLEHDRIDISEGIDFNKCEETSRECSLCKLYYFLDKNFKYGPYLCDGCYDMSMKVVSMQNLAIINHNGNYYRVIFKNNTLFVYNIKMSSQKIKFGDKEVDKKIIFI